MRINDLPGLPKSVNKDSSEDRDATTSSTFDSVFSSSISREPNESAAKSWPEAPKGWSEPAKRWSDSPVVRFQSDQSRALSDRLSAKPMTTDAKDASATKQAKSAPPTKRSSQRPTRPSSARASKLPSRSVAGDRADASARIPRAPKAMTDKAATKVTQADAARDESALSTELEAQTRAAEQMAQQAALQIAAQLTPLQTAPPSWEKLLSNADFFVEGDVKIAGVDDASSLLETQSSAAQEVPAEATVAPWDPNAVAATVGQAQALAWLSRSDATPTPTLAATGTDNLARSVTRQENQRTSTNLKVNLNDLVTPEASKATDAKLEIDAALTKLDDTSLKSTKAATFTMPMTLKTDAPLLPKTDAQSAASQTPIDQPQVTAAPTAQTQTKADLRQFLRDSAADASAAAIASTPTIDTNAGLAKDLAAAFSEARTKFVDDKLGHNTSDDAPVRDEAKGTTQGGQLRDLKATGMVEVRAAEATASTKETRSESRAEMVNKVAEHVQMMLERGGKATEVKVDTQHGAVRVRIEMDGTTVHIKFATEQSQAQAQLRAGIDDLQKRLQDQGYRLGDVGFSHQGQAQADSRQNQSQRNREEMTDESMLTTRGVSARGATGIAKELDAAMRRLEGLAQPPV